jgi:hypothetical protein
VLDDRLDGEHLHQPAPQVAALGRGRVGEPCRVRATAQRVEPLVDGGHGDRPSSHPRGDRRHAVTSTVIGSV